MDSFKFNYIYSNLNLILIYYSYKYFIYYINNIYYKILYKIKKILK